MPVQIEVCRRAVFVEGEASLDVRNQLDILSISIVQSIDKSLPFGSGGNQIGGCLASVAVDDRFHAAYVGVGVLTVASSLIIYGIFAAFCCCWNRRAPLAVIAELILNGSVDSRAGRHQLDS